MLKKYFLVLLCVASSSTLAASYKTGHFTIEYDDDVPDSVVEKLARMGALA